MQNEILIFFHLPKAGGTTLNSIIYKNIDPNNIWKYCEYEHERELKGIGEALKENRIECITGHMAFGLHELTPNFKYITLLREPTGRVLSYYNHFKRVPMACKNMFVGIEREFDKNEAQNWTIEELLDSRISCQIHNGYVRFFAGRNGLPISLHEKERLTKEDLDKAKSNLEKYFSVVAITEEYNKSLLLLKKYAGIKDIFYVKKNQAPKKMKAKPLPESTVDYIKQNNQLDIEFYAFAKELMLKKFAESNLDKELIDFEKDLAEYRKTYVTPKTTKTDKINDILKTIPDNKKVALYSCGFHTKNMFELTDIKNMNIECILDTYQDNASFENCKVVKADKLPSMDIDVIIISNFHNQNTIISYLRDTLHYDKEIISFYTAEDDLPFYEY